MTSFKITYTPLGDRVALTFPYSSAVVGILRGMQGAKWDPSGKRWTIPMSSYLTARAALRGFAAYAPGLPNPELEFDRTTPVVDPAEVDAALEGYQFKTKPYEHQRVAMALGVRAKRFGLFMEMGTGKTKVSIDILSLWLERGYIGGALIVCPKAVVINWEREIAVHSPLPAEKRRTASLRGELKKKLETFEQSRYVAQFFVTNYATLLQDIPLDALVSTRRLAIVLDESTGIKTHSAKTSKGAHRLGRLADHKLILTGTPITQGPLDSFSQFLFLDPGITGHHSYFSFKAEFAMVGGYQGREIVGYKNLDRLVQRLQPHMYRVLKRDCLDLPEKVYRTVEVEAGAKQRKVYNELKEENIAEVDGYTITTPVTLAKMTRLAQITSGYLPKIDEYGHEVGIIEFEVPKVDAAEELVEEAVEGGQKVIVWVRFIHELKMLEKRLERFGVVTYHGAVKDDQRQQNVDKFQTDPAVRVFIGQIQTGGIAITLTAASVELYVSNTFALVDRLQSEDRAHRIGQKRSVTIIDIVVRGTLDSYVLRTLRDKKSLADVITGDNIREVVGNA